MNDAAANKRIAKNTLMLYFRTFITMLVGLYTGRVMLAALGVENYGINNVVGGIVAMSSFLTGAISSTITRFITYALGEGDKQRMKLVFSTSVNVQIVISFIAVVTLELVGGWFLNTAAVIPEGRMTAAHWVFQCSIVTLILSLVCAPYSAVIVAHERMSIYAYMSIVDVVLKLAICFAIMAYDGDRLILLAVLNVSIGLAMRIFYGWYCGRHFEEAHYSCTLFDRAFIKEMSQFTGWFLVGNGVWVLNTQGLNLLTNTFFGVVFNAARGVAMTVTSALSSFVNNFTVAFVPQITKSYASGDRERLMDLMFQGTKITWYLFLVLIIPVFVEADSLLKLWLGTPPDHAVLFLRFALIESWSISISFALHHAILASGKLKRVQLKIAIYTSFIFPITWFGFRMGAPAWTAYLVFIVLNTTAKGFTIAELRRIIEFPALAFIRKVVLRGVIVTAVAFFVPLFIVAWVPQSLIRFLAVVPLAVLWTMICVYWLGIDSAERVWIGIYTRKLINKFEGGI